MAECRAGVASRGDGAGKQAGLSMHWSQCTTGYPFVCGPAPPCEDDPTFQSLGSFGCGTTSPDICDIDAENAGPACGVRRAGGLVIDERTGERGNRREREDVWTDDMDLRW